MASSSGSFVWANGVDADEDSNGCQEVTQRFSYFNSLSLTNGMDTRSTVNRSGDSPWPESVRQARLGGNSLSLRHLAATRNENCKDASSSENLDWADAAYFDGDTEDGVEVALRSSYGKPIPKSTRLAQSVGQQNAMDTKREYVGRTIL